MTGQLEAQEAKPKTADAGYLQTNFFYTDMAACKSKAPADTAAPRTLEKSWTDIDQTIDKRVKSAWQELFKHDVADFVARPDLPPSEKAKTLDEISRLLKAEDGVVEGSLRRRAAQEMIHHAANPLSVGQGDHPTCGPNSIAQELYQSQPSLAARITTDSLLAGQWTGKDGKVIDLPAETLARSQADSGRFPPSPGERSYAVQVIESALMNDIGAHTDPPMRYTESAVPVFKDVPADDPGQLMHAQHNWIMADGSLRSVVKPGSENFSQSGGIAPWQVTEEINRLTGKEHSLLRFKGFSPNDTPPPRSLAASLQDNGFVYFANQSELETKLNELNQSGQFPMLASVNGKRSENVKEDSAIMPPPEQTKLADEDHFIGITEYKPGNRTQPAMVRIHDGSTSDADAWISVQQLFDLSR